MEAPELYDLLILVDATASMGNYLHSLQSSLPKIISISRLTDCFSRIGLLAYRDYCDTDLLEWSGWHYPNEPELGLTSAELIFKAKNLRATGGGDYPEATKTGLAQMYKVIRKEATTLVLLYTDAPPHTKAYTKNSGYTNGTKEIEALSRKDSFDGHGPKFVDWVSACQLLHTGEKRAQVFCFLGSMGAVTYSGHYIYLSTMARGATFLLEDSKPSTISQLTVDVLLSWMGAGKDGLAHEITVPAEMARYKSIARMKTLKNEDDSKTEGYFVSVESPKSSSKTLKNNVATAPVTASLLKQHLPKKEVPVQDFAQRYNTNAGFKKLVGEQLAQIMETDVSAISLNPVFGSLWRAVCNDRENPIRDELITAFSLKVDRIAEEEEKTRMKLWLEESYDYRAEVLETIADVPVENKFPCVLLDPTLFFETGAEAGGSDDEAHRPITDFKRDELLEIGRSCDYRILRRLGRVLTRLTFVNSAAELPAHIAATTDEVVPKIPLALAEKKHNRKFWKILLHIVVPGTKLATRPAGLLAALAIKMGVRPLYEVAAQEMMALRDRWDDLEVPETWNASCLSLLLDADKAYHESVSGSANGEDSRTPLRLLKKEDRKLFECLVSYKLAEANLLTTLTARIGWTPEKAVLPVGPLVICRSCDFPRSVTVMAAHGICGLCKATDYDSKAQKMELLAYRVTKDDTEASDATWVECNLRSCRAQYVVYGINRLNIKPKCHYCREQASLSPSKRSDNPAPWIECKKCLNRVIWPKEYRKSTSKPFHCVACSTDRATIVNIETNADEVIKENGQAWLLRNQDQKILEPFNKRSLFHTISTAGTDDFCAKVELFPGLPAAASNLTIKGKLIRNIPEVKSQLQSWITRRATENVHCSLCFSMFRKERLRLACGRSGCAQRICEDCLSSWYGLNSAGHIINVAALGCPFCRRAPRAKTLAAYGMGIHAVGNLKAAVEEHGEWIHAWCRDCSQAKRLMERVCAAGAPPALTTFTCETCIDASYDAAAREADRVAAELAATRDAIRIAELAERLERANLKKEELGRNKAKPCPGCGALTEKISGCDHMECAVPHCGCHWCWCCGDAFDSNEIYSHMETAHGGYYAGGHSEDEDDY